SPLMQRLFDFLLECSIAGKAPKEIEVAVDAFGKGAEFDVSQDAMVRVYIHKLRRKLEEFYAGPGAGEPVRLSIPKGEYRFVVEAAAVAPVEDEESAELVSVAPPATRRRWVLPVLITSAVLNVAVLAFLFLRPSAPPDDFRAVRENRVWAPLLSDDRTIFVVVGDYYIFGETDDSMEVKRLVREFDINSPQDLENHVKLNPELGDRYMDMELAYLPTASAYALRDVMPVLAPANKRVRIVPMSQLNPAVIKSSDIVYVGYLSGLGMLGDYVFASSRLSVGDSFDELVDRGTKQRYVSQATGASIRGERKFHDYGYFATFNGPSGNHIVVIAGTRDVAAMHMAETLTKPNALQALTTSAGKTPGFEALYEVYGMDKLNLDGKLLLTSPLDSNTIWTGGPSEVHAALSGRAADSTSH
ncbi:MAG TPA: hypothetical protein VMF89_02600, partial [Polyangiales bacterium]|nr:hypothetical protein [Polyangiales bacterium]